MKQLAKRKLGNSNLLVSRMALGTVPLSGLGARTTYDDFEGTIQAALDQGVLYFDTAPGYGNGRTEHFLGHFLRAKELRPDVVISTKVGRVLKTRRRARKTDKVIFGIEWIDGLPFVDEFDYSYDGIMRSFEDSQQRFGIDDIDIIHVHDIGRLSHGDDNDRYWTQLQDGGFKALRELRESGAVKAVSIGVNETAAVLDMANEFPLDCCLIAGRYTLINDEASSHFFPECERRGIDVIAAGVFNSGILAGGSKGSNKLFDYADAPQSIIDKVKAVEEVCDEFSVALPTAAVQFVAAHPAVATVLVGAKSPAEIQQNVAALTAAIPVEFWEKLKARKLVGKQIPTPVV